MTYQTETTRKPVYKTVWFWLLTAFALAGAFIMFVLAVGALTGSPTASEEPSPTVTETVTAEPADAPTEQSNNDADVPREWENALTSGQKIADRNNSKVYVYRTLTSEVYGFPDEAAQYAIDNITDEWNERALNAAKQIQDRGNSHEYVRRTLSSDVYGFTDSEVEYAIANLEP